MDYYNLRILNQLQKDFTYLVQVGGHVTKLLLNVNFIILDQTCV